MTDAVFEKLREALLSGYAGPEVRQSAADELERLREALKPFAALWHQLHPATRKHVFVRINVEPAAIKRAEEVLK